MSNENKIEQIKSLLNIAGFEQKDTKEFYKFYAYEYYKDDNLHRYEILLSFKYIKIYNKLHSWKLISSETIEELDIKKFSKFLTRFHEPSQEKSKELIETTKEQPYFVIAIYQWKDKNFYSGHYIMAEAPERAKDILESNLSSEKEVIGITATRITNGYVLFEREF